jgi:hypothetical protein
MDNMLLLVAVFAAVVVIAVLVVMTLGQRRRGGQVAASAEALGYKFTPADATFIETLRGLPFFSEAGQHARTTTNLMRSEKDGVVVTCLDYGYGTGPADHRSQVRQSVLVLESARLDLPAFSLHPEGLGQKLGGAMGGQDIDFKDNPGFSNAFVLQGADPAAVAALFDRPKQDFFAQHRGVYVEGCGRQLIYYRKGKLVSPKAIPAFIDEGLAVARLMAG